MNRLITKRLIFFLGIILFFGTCQSFFAVEPLWKRALGGDVVAGPIESNDRIYVVTSDRSITCLASDGNFLWNRPIPGKPLPLLSASETGMVYTVTEAGVITAYNVDGNVLWQIRGREPPLFAPTTGRDGRFFLVYRKSIVCLSPIGSVKWSLSINANPAMSLSETGDGDLLLACSEPVILRISPFGELLEYIQTDAPAKMLSPIPGGFVAGFPDGTLRAYDVRNGRMSAEKHDTEEIWSYSSKAGLVAFIFESGTIALLDSGGTVTGLNATDGAMLWTSPGGIPVTAPAAIFFDYGQFNVTFSGFAFAYGFSGNPMWRFPFPMKDSNPVLTGNGIAYTSGHDSVLYAWKVETRIKMEKKSPKRKNYSILNEKSSQYGMFYLSDTESIRSFFNEVETNVTNGTVGINEADYARRLVEILHNDSGEGASGGRQFDSTERSRAASLLGQLGSDEYRNELIGLSAVKNDDTLSAGILFGLSDCGSDYDGKALSAVEHIVREAGSRNDTVQMAACDTLYVIIRYSSGKTAEEGTKMLVRFMESPYDFQVQLYVKKLIGNILKK